MRFIYASSTYPIYLGLYLKIFQNEEVHFLYSRKIYKEVFELLKLHSTYVPVPTVREYLLKSKKIKRQISDVDNLIGFNDLLFTHTQFASFLFLILNSNNYSRKKFFYDFEPITQNRYAIKDIINNFKSFTKSFLSLISFRIFYSTKVKLSFYSSSFFLSLSHKQLSNLGVRLADSDLSYEELQLKVINKIQIDVPKISNLYISQNEINMRGSILEENGVNSLIKIISDNDIFVKPHPSGYPYPMGKEVISAAIPSEFLFESITNSIISINSTSLISASHYFWKKPEKNIKVICLMKLVPILDKQSNDEMQKRMKERCMPNVIYPSSFLELETLLQ